MTSFNNLELFSVLSDLPEDNKIRVNVKSCFIDPRYSDSGSTTFSVLGSVDIINQSFCKVEMILTVDQDGNEEYSATTSRYITIALREPKEELFEVSRRIFKEAFKARPGYTFDVYLNRNLTFYSYVQDGEPKLKHQTISLGSPA